MKHTDIVTGSDYSTTAKSGKLLHLEHPEDIILQQGTFGAILVSKILTDVVDAINQKSDNAKISIKFDGSPSVVFGHNSENGRFFVGTKSVFNKLTPKILYSNADIQNFYADKPDLEEKLQYALTYLKEICPKNGVFQGDLLFTHGMISPVMIDAEEYVTFTPNTISYAIPTGSGGTLSELASNVLRARMGIAVHTVYTGDNLQTMVASPLIAALKSSGNVWVADVSLDFSRSFLTSRNIEKMIKQIGDSTNIDVLASKPELADILKIYINYLIKQGISAPSASKIISGFAKFYTDRKTDEMNILKTEKAKIIKKNKTFDDLKFMSSHKKELLDLIKIYKLIIEVKNILLDELNALNTIETFVKKVSGFEKTFPEGFVVTDTSTGNTIKLIDRHSFSKENFLKQENK